jgi:hypothetical protein
MWVLSRAYSPHSHYQVGMLSSFVVGMCLCNLKSQPECGPNLYERALLCTYPIKCVYEAAGSCHTFVGDKKHSLTMHAEI